MDINWKYKTLEKLENDYWGHPNYDSYLVTRVHEIRKISLLELTNDDIAMMLRQKFSLDYIVPLAVERIRKNKEKIKSKELLGKVTSKKRSSKQLA